MTLRSAGTKRRRALEREGPPFHVEVDVFPRPTRNKLTRLRRAVAQHFLQSAGGPRQ